MQGKTKFSTGFHVSDTDFVLLHGTPYWTDMFVRHFLFESDQSIDADDLLFFVRKKPIKGSTRFLMKFEVYINCVSHAVDYQLILSFFIRLK